MKGIAYTSFAILASITLLAVITFPSEYMLYDQTNDLDSSERLMVTQQALESNLDDLTASRAENHFQKFNQNISESGFITGDSEEEYTESYEQGFNNLSSSFQDLDDNYQYLDNLEMENLGVDFENGRKFYQYEKRYNLTQNHREIRSSQSPIKSFKIEGLDPLLSKNTGDSFEYNLCNKEIVEVFEGESSSGAVINGEFVYNPGDLSKIDDKDDKVLVVTRTEPYDDGIEDFRAVITQNSDWESGDTEYVNGVDLFDFSPTEFTRVIVDAEDIYFTNILDLSDRGCYTFEVPDNEAPTVYDRMENQTDNFREDSIARFVEPGTKSNDEDANIGFLTFTSSRKDNRRVRGISSVDEGREEPEFRFPVSFLEYYNMDDLAINS